ncbi:MAG: hypothetical protein HS115_18565 [Spirochaetales bacterium]|nr:hypothetical protein [Spirochaetales bacterium]
MIWWALLLLSGLGCSVCHLIIMIYAFRHHPEKAMIAILFPVYLPYYLVKDYDSPRKVPVLLAYGLCSLGAILAVLQLV